MAVSVRHKTYDLATDPARGRVRARVVALLGLGLILFNVGAATLLGATAQANSSLLDGLAGDRIVLCVSVGAVAGDGQGNSAPQGHGDGPMCPFCLPLMQANVLPPDNAILDVAPVREPSAFIPRQERACIVPARWAGAFSPRAPPPT